MLDRMPNLPSGTVTFLFSDIEGSTALLKDLGDAGYASLLAEHRRLVRETLAAHDGQEIDTQGDAFFYSFPRARQAVAAAVAVQRAHAETAWPNDLEVRVRIGLHTGEPAIGEEGYTGLDVVRAARIAAVGHGGQVLLSETTRALVGADLPAGVTIHALGEQRLKDIDRPEPLHELTIAGIEPSHGPPPSVARQPDAAAATPEVAGLSKALVGVPGWVRDVAAPLAPPRSAALGSFGERAREAIEARVLAGLEASLREAGGHPSAAPESPAPAIGPEAGRASGAPSASVADEIARLRELRDAGALTDDQYRRAVDRVIGADGS